MASRVLAGIDPERDRGGRSELRVDSPRGRYRLKVEETVFRPQDYNRFLLDNSRVGRRLQSDPQGAFEAERGRWRSAGQAE